MPLQGLAGRSHRLGTTPDLGQPPEGRESQIASPSGLGRERGLGIGVADGAQDLMLGHSCLHEHDASTGARPDESRRAYEEPEALFGGSVARREELLVEVQEGDEANRAPRFIAGPVERRLGPDDDVEGDQRGTRPVDGDDLMMGHEPGELVPEPDDAGLERTESSAPAVSTPQLLHGLAPPAPQASVALGDGRVATRATGRLTAGPAEQEVRPAPPVEHAHRSPTVVEGTMQRRSERGREQSEPRRIVAAVDDLDAGPAGASHVQWCDHGSPGHLDGLNRRGRGDDVEAGSLATRALVREVARVPGGCPFFCECLVGIVEHDRGAKIRDGGKYRDTTTHYDARPAS